MMTDTRTRPRVLIVFDTRYGNTKLVAETIAEGIEDVVKADVILRELAQVEPAELAEYELVLIGSPNHYSAPTKGIKEFIDGLEEIILDGKRGAVFDTYLGAGFHERAVKQMEKRMNEKASGLQLMSPGLSIRVEKNRGPIVDGELPRCKDFGKKIALQLLP